MNSELDKTLQSDQAIADFVLADGYMPSDAIQDPKLLEQHNVRIADAITKFGANDLVRVLIDELVRARNMRDTADRQCENMHIDHTRMRGQNDALRSILVEALRSHEFDDTR